MSRVARFDLRRAIVEGTGLMRAHPVVTVIGGGLAILSTNGSAAANRTTGDLVSRLGTPEAPELAAWAGVALLAMGVAVCADLVPFLVRAFVAPGWVRTVRRALRGEPVALSGVFEGVDALGRQLGWQLVQLVVVSGGALLVAAPGVLAAGAVGLAGGPKALAVAVFLGFGALPALGVRVFLGARLALGDVLVALDGAGPMEALAGSWEATRVDPLGAIVFQLGLWALLVVAVVLGVLSCCVGLLVTVPWWSACWYAGVVRAVEVDEPMWLEPEPEP